MRTSFTKLFLFCLIFVFCFMQSTSAQAPDTSWTKTFGSNDWNFGSSVHQTYDGGFIIAGQTQSISNDLEFWLLKTNALGDTLWTKTYGGNNFDECLYVQQTSDSGYIITGKTRSFGAGDDDIWLLKTNALGDTLWSKTYGGSAKDLARIVRQTSDGGYILTGGTRSFAVGYYDLWILKTDSIGDTLWTKSYGTTTYESGFDIQETTGGGYIVAAGTLTNFWLVKTDSFGDTLWTKKYGGGNEEPNSVVQTEDGGYMIVGRTQSFGEGASDIWLVKTDEFGDTLWTKTYGGTDYEDGRTVQQTPDGGYFITGKTESFGSGGIDSWILKTDSFGDTLWTKIMGGINDDEALSGHQISDGGYIITGYTESFGSNTRDLWLIKLDGPSSLTIPAITVTSCDDELVSLPIYGDLADTIKGFRISGSFEPSINNFDITTTGLSTESWQETVKIIDSINHTFDYVIVSLGTPLSPGNHTLCNFSFKALSECITSYKIPWTIDSVQFSDALFNTIIPNVTTDSTEILGFTPGDFNGDSTVDISDLVGLVEYMFQEGITPCNLAAVDVAPVGNPNCQLDISDLVRLVDYMFVTVGNPPLDCGCSNVVVSKVSSTIINEDIILSSEIIDNKTQITLNSNSDTRGIQLYLNGDNVSSIESQFNNLDLLYRQDENIVKIGLLDLDGAEFIPQGENKILVLDGEFEIVSALVVDAELNSYAPVLETAKGGILPNQFSLSQNYPNPFNPTTTISFSLPEASNVKLEVYNINGQVVTTLVNEYFEAGNHIINWDGREKSSGMYLYKIEAGNFIDMKKMMLLK